MMTLDRLFCPRGVAVVGSTTPGKIGYELVKQIVDGGFEHVYAVNPKGQGACGAPGYASIAQHRGPGRRGCRSPLPPPTVPAVLEDCGAAGIHAAVVITSGFSEVGNKTGEEEIQRIARRHGIRMVGPNCAGVVNTHHQPVRLSGDTAAGRRTCRSSRRAVPSVGPCCRGRKNRVSASPSS